MQTVFRMLTRIVTYMSHVRTKSLEVFTKTTPYMTCTLCYGIYIWLQCTMFFTVFIILNFNQCNYGIVGSIGGKEICHELVEQVMS